jgi:hypothetical protein
LKGLTDIEHVEHATCACPLLLNGAVRAGERELLQFRRETCVNQLAGSQQTASGAARAHAPVQHAGSQRGEPASSPRDEKAGTKPQQMLLTPHKTTTATCLISGQQRAHGRGRGRHQCCNAEPASPRPHKAQSASARGPMEKQAHKQQHRAVRNKNPTRTLLNYHPHRTPQTERTAQERVTQGSHRPV